THRRSLRPQRRTESVHIHGVSQRWVRGWRNRDLLPGRRADASRRRGVAREARTRKGAGLLPLPFARRRTGRERAEVRVANRRDVSRRSWELRQENKDRRPLTRRAAKRSGG